MNSYPLVYGSLVSGTFPRVKAKNATTSASRDGTPYEARVVDDIWGFFQTLLSRAGLTPSGVSESVDASQLMAALHDDIRGPGEFALSALNATELAKRRLLPLYGQVIEIASYPDLCAAVYCGDDSNDSAPAFYKTSDSSGGTRTTAGTYMVLPDCRGLFARGIGPNSKIQPPDGASHYTGGNLVGQLSYDAMFSHWHAGYAPGSGSLTGFASTSSASASIGAALGGAVQVRSPVADASTSFGTPRTTYENRPANFSGQWCITY